MVPIPMEDPSQETTAEDVHSMFSDAPSFEHQVPLGIVIGQFSDALFDVAEYWIGWSSCTYIIVDYSFTILLVFSPLSIPTCTITLENMRQN